MCITIESEKTKKAIGKKHENKNANNQSRKNTCIQLKSENDWIAQGLV